MLRKKRLDSGTQWGRFAILLCRAASPPKEARAVYTETQRRRRTNEDETTLRGISRGKENPMNCHCKSEVQSIGVLLDNLDGNPWGRPYRMFRNKLLLAVFPATETLDPGFFRDIVAAFFSRNAVEDGYQREDPGVVQAKAGWTKDLYIFAKKLTKAVRKMLKKKTAPGTGFRGGCSLSLYVLWGTDSGVCLTGAFSWGGF